MRVEETRLEEELLRSGYLGKDYTLMLEHKCCYVDEVPILKVAWQEEGNEIERNS